MSSDPTGVPDPSELDLAIVSALAYADVFDYPLTVAQIHRYLVRTPATMAQVEAALALRSVAGGTRRAARRPGLPARAVGEHRAAP